MFGSGSKIFAGSKQEEASDMETNDIKLVSEPEEVPQQKINKISQKKRKNKKTKRAKKRRHGKRNMSTLLVNNDQTGELPLPQDVTLPVIPTEDLIIPVEVAKLVETNKTILVSKPEETSEQKPKKSKKKKN